MKRRSLLSFKAITVTLSASVLVLSLIMALFPDTLRATADDAILVKFKSGMPDDAKRSINARLRVTKKGSIAPLGIDILAVPVDRSIESLVHDYRRNPNVEFAEPDYQAFAVQEANDTYYGAQWHLAKISAPAGWDLTTGNDSVTVAIVDSGIQLDHPDLAARLVPGYDFVNNDQDPTDDYGHGTGVAGVVGAVTNNAAGVASITWAGKLMPVKVLGAYGSGSYSDVAKGITYAVDNGAQIVNLSLGGSSPSSALRSAIRYATSKDVLVIAAAGNSGGAILYPAAYRKAVAVGATDWDDSKAWFSSYGSGIDLAAPGVSIYTTTRTGYGRGSGTSFASPLVAGLAALISSQHPEWSSRQILRRMEKTADDLGSRGRDDYFGHGRINVDKALR